MTTISIMQPYFMPYSGYFRLFSQVDIFVVFDDVQFPRRSWVHRNKLHDSDNQLKWLTLPLKKQAYLSSIQQMKFANDATEQWCKRIKKFSILHHQPYHALHQQAILNYLYQLTQTPLSYIVSGLKLVTELLDIVRPVVFASDLSIDSKLRGQDRIIAIAKQLNATCYVNAPGGREFYQTEKFTRHGLTLSFLPEYQGPTISILERLMIEDIDIIKQSICSSI